MAGLALLLFLCTVNNVCQTQLFTALEGSNTFPCAFSSSAAAYNNLTQTVLFFGGSYPCSKQMVQFELQSASFTQYNSTYLNQEMYGNGQHYTQLDDILWVLAVDGTDMYRIDVQTLNVQNASSAIQNVGVGAWACLASMTQYIFVISDRVISTLVQIYDINSNQWLDLDNVPTLNTKRTASSCVVVSNHLYVIGGNFDNDQYLDTIEKLYVGDDLKSLSSQSWQIINDTLMNPMQKMSVAHAAQNIYVVGGMKEDLTVVSNIEIIDTTSDSVRQWGTLHTAVAAASAVVIENTLFIFAGATAGFSSINTYQYITLPATNTNNPSKIPTNIPSVVPSVFPTASPSKLPTNIPSAVPSVFPTKSPTKLPTDIPNAVPSIFPTTSPTKLPTYIPTQTTDVATQSPLNDTLYEYVINITIDFNDTNITSIELQNILSDIIQNELNTSFDNDTNCILDDDVVETQITDNSVTPQTANIAVLVCNKAPTDTLIAYFEQHLQTTIIDNLQDHAILTANVEMTPLDSDLVHIPPKNTLSQNTPYMKSTILAHGNPAIKTNIFNDFPWIIILLCCAIFVVCMLLIVVCVKTTRNRRRKKNVNNNIMMIAQMRNKIMKGNYNVYTPNGASTGGAGILKDEVRSWLEQCNMTQYFQAFISHGYERLDIIMEISSITELMEIGIDCTEHKTKLLSEIYKLQRKTSEKLPTLTTSKTPGKDTSKTPGKHTLTPQMTRIGKKEMNEEQYTDEGDVNDIRNDP